MQKNRSNYLTYKQVVNIVTCLNLRLAHSPITAVIFSRKLYKKLVEHDLVDDCCFNFIVASFWHVPFPYSLIL